MSEIELTRDPAHLRHGSNIGRPLTRREGVLKVTGRARYAADNHPPGMLYAVIAASKIARGRVASLDVAAAKAHPGVLFATAGVHPHHAIDYDDATDALLRELAHDPLVRAIGETGLDYNRNYSPREVQLQIFERQLQMAVDLQKPLFLHQRDAHTDFLAMLRRYRDKVPGAVVHCFTDTGEALRDYLALDCHIGITGWICDERRGAHLRELVREIPTNRLMIETDAPYLLPRTVRPQPKHRRNEPMYLRHICEEIARDRGESADVTAANSTTTAEAFFGLS